MLLVPKDVEYIGDLNTPSYLQVEGVVRGRINAPSVYVAPEAAVEGTIFTLNATVRGRILGDVFVAGTFILETGGSVEGNIQRNAYDFLRLSVRRLVSTTKETFFPRPEFLVTVIMVPE